MPSLASGGANTPYPAILEHGGVLGSTTDQIQVGSGHYSFCAPFVFDMDGFLWYRPVNKERAIVARFVLPDGSVRVIKLDKPIKSRKVVKGGKVYPYFELDPKNPTASGVSLDLASAPPTSNVNMTAPREGIEHITPTAVTQIGGLYTAGYEATNLLDMLSGAYYRPTPDAEGYVGWIYDMPERADGLHVVAHCGNCFEVSLSTDNGATWEDVGFVNCTSPNGDHAMYAELPEYKADGPHKLRFRTKLMSPNPQEGSHQEIYMYQAIPFKWKNRDHMNFAWRGVRPYAWNLYGQATSNDRPFRMIQSYDNNGTVYGWDKPKNGWFGNGFCYSPVRGVSINGLMEGVLSVGSSPSDVHTQIPGGNVNFPWNDQFIDDAHAAQNYYVYPSGIPRYDDPNKDSIEPHSVRLQEVNGSSNNENIRGMQMYFGADIIDPVTGITRCRWTNCPVSRVYYGGFITRHIIHEEGNVDIPNFFHTNASYSNQAGFFLNPFTSWSLTAYRYPYKWQGFPWGLDEIDVQVSKQIEHLNNARDSLKMDADLAVIEDKGSCYELLCNANVYFKLNIKRNW